MLNQFDKRLALLEQSHEHESKISAARGNAAEKAIEVIGAKIDSAIAMWQAVTAEPTASPAGRAMTADINELAVKVAAHEQYIQQANGALRIARFALGTSLVALVGLVLQLASALAGGSGA